MKLLTNGTIVVLILLAIGASPNAYSAFLSVNETGKSFEEVRAGAEGGDAQDQYRLGWMYSTGHLVGQDYSKAAEWYGKSARQGNAQGENALGVLYLNGFGVSQSYDQAIFWYRKAADQEEPKAEFNLGRLYFYGRGVQQDRQEAFRWYERAAEHGDPDAQRIVGTRWVPAGIRGQALLLILALASMAYAVSSRNSHRGSRNGIDWFLFALAASSALYSLAVVYMIPWLDTGQSLAIDHVCFLLRNIFYGLYAAEIAGLVLSGNRKARVQMIALIALALVLIGINVDFALHHTALSNPGVLRAAYAAYGFLLGLVTPLAASWAWGRRVQRTQCA
jgi:hypothetical protein